MLWRWFFAPLRRRMLLYTAWTLLELEKRSAAEGLEAEHWLEYMISQLDMPAQDYHLIRDLIRIRRAD